MWQDRSRVPALGIVGLVVGAIVAVVASDLLARWQVGPHAADATVVLDVPGEAADVIAFYEQVLVDARLVRATVLPRPWAARPAGPACPRWWHP